MKLGKAALWKKVDGRDAFNFYIHTFLYYEQM